MPGRNGYSTQGGWAEGGSNANGVPGSLTLDGRLDNQPPEYVASEQIEFVDGFESGVGDEFSAYITDGSGGSGGSGAGGEYASGGYRYGFNGKENDNEVKGEGAQQDYGMRIYDTRLGRFLSVDPLRAKFPWLTTYQFASNKPTRFNDIDGKEAPEEDDELLEREREEFEERFTENMRRHNEEIEREREREYRTNPTTRALGSAVQTMRMNNYWNSAFGAASFVLSQGGVTDNKKLGNQWDDFIKDQLLKNPDCIGVARQVSLKVTGEVNGKILTANIRIDNVGIRKDPVTGSPIFDLVEAKWSVEDVTIGMLKQTLTVEQGKALVIAITGKNVQISIRGKGSAQKLSEPFNINKPLFKEGQVINAYIKGVGIILPLRNSSTGTVNGVKVATPSGTLPKPQSKLPNQQKD